MRTLCVVIPEALYQQLEAAAHESNLKISDVVRTLLKEGIENKNSRQGLSATDESLQREMMRYAIITYWLVEDAMQNLVANGSKLSAEFHRKVERLIHLLFSKFFLCDYITCPCFQFRLAR